MSCLFSKKDGVYIPTYIDKNINDDEYKKFGDIQESDNWGNFFYGKYGEEYRYIVKQLHEHESNSHSYKVSADSLAMYCGYNYLQINNMMRGISIENIDLNIMINNILTTMYRSPALKEKMILYRVVSQNTVDKIIESDKEGSTFIEKGFMSTALSYEGVSDIEKPCLLKIYLNYYEGQNVHGLYVNEYTNRRGETELLLMPDLFIRLLDKPYWDELIKKWVYKVTVLTMRVL